MFFFEDFGRFQTGYEKMKEAIAQAHRLAPTLKPIFIIGDAGSGKKEMALEIISRSSRGSRSVIRWNADCESFQTIDCGTVLVENLQNFSRSQQEVLLKRIVLCLGERALSSPRWIVTGCREILSWVRRGEILHSLYHLLSEQMIVMPNLQERKDDLEFIIQGYVENLNEIFSTQKKLTSGSLRRLTTQKYEKNWKEIFEKIEKAYVNAQGPLIDLKAFGIEDLSISSEWAQVGLSLSEMERRFIMQTLEVTQQNRTKAAEMLGISIRTLRNKLTEYRDQEGV